MVDIRIKKGGVIHTEVMIRAKSKEHHRTQNLQQESRTDTNLAGGDQVKETLQALAEVLDRLLY